MTTQSGDTAMTEQLCSYEIEVLQMMTGERPGEWGAWVSEVLGSLKAKGLCTRGPSYQITDKGRLELARWLTQA